MDLREIRVHVNDYFSTKYAQFQEFQKGEQYKEYWNKCMSVFMNRDLLMCIIFCNDVFSIPPVKTFLLYFKEDFRKITGNGNLELNDFVKKSIGAFWGMVFKSVLGYGTQKSVSVSLKEFGVKTASHYSKPNEKIEIFPKY